MGSVRGLTDDRELFFWRQWILIHCFLELQPFVVPVMIPWNIEKKLMCHIHYTFLAFLCKILMFLEGFNRCGKDLSENHLFPDFSKSRSEISKHFWKGPDEHFGFCGPYDLSCSYLALPL